MLSLQLLLNMETVCATVLGHQPFQYQPSSRGKWRLKLICCVYDSKQDNLEGLDGTACYDKYFETGYGLSLSQPSALHGKAYFLRVCCFFFFSLHYKCKIEDVTENIPLVHQENAYSLANFIQPALCKYFMPLSTQQSPPITKKRKKKKQKRKKEMVKYVP